MSASEERTAVDALLAWATARGAVLNGIRATPLPGRGIGVVATRALEADEVVLTVPTDLLRSHGATSASIVRKLHGASTHAVLAASLCLDLEDPSFSAWRGVMPSRQQITASMPLFWPAAVLAHLPEAAHNLLDQQKAKVATDWGRVGAALPDMACDDYFYAWALVNTRCFYHSTPQAAAKRQPHDDRMILQPIGDLFNHHPAADNCSVAFNRQGYTVSTKRPHQAGEELYLCYGRHSNDLLLVEYGFTLPQNPWDEVSLDPYLCPLFSSAQRRQLDARGFWAGYVLDANTACYRTQTALRLLCIAPAQWRAVLDGSRDEGADEAAVEAELLKLVRRLEKQSRGKMQEVDRDVVGDEMRLALRTRWLQVKEIAIASRSRLKA